MADTDTGQRATGATLFRLSRTFASRRGDPVVTHVDPAIFVRRYFAACMDCTFCHDSCCQYGCDVDLENVGWLQGEFADRLEPYLGVPREQWFNEQVHHDPDLPGGSFRRAAVIDGACAFRNRTSRGCGIHSYCLENGIDYHTIKPHVCWLFPLMIESGVLCPPSEVLDQSLICVDQGQTLYQAQRGEMLAFFGEELVAELDALEAQTLAGLPATTTTGENAGPLLQILTPGKSV